MPDTTASIQCEHLVVIVPGIRDRGIAWHSVLRELRQAGLSAEIIGWSEYFGAIPFLIPAPWFRRSAMNKLELKLRDALQAYSGTNSSPKVSFISHSFGSYILCHLLRRVYHFKAHRIILCGSVVSRRFKFSGFEERFDPPVLNEVGTMDRWPLVASAVTFGYGSIGTYGYFGAPVIDRFHLNAGHGHFTNAGFTTKFWLPFLLETGRNGVVPGDEPTEESGLKRTSFRLLQHLKWLLLAAMVYALVVAMSKSHCDPQIAPIESLTWADDLAWIHSAISFEKNRLERQNESVCRFLPVNWPKPVTVVHYQTALNRIAACGDKRSVATAQGSAIAAITAISRAFPNCFEVKLGTNQTTVELLVAPPSRVQQRVDLGTHEGEWILCSCDDAAVKTLKIQRIGSIN